MGSIRLNAVWFYNSVKTSTLLHMYTWNGIGEAGLTSQELIRFSVHIDIQEHRKYNSNAYGFLLKYFFVSVLLFPKDLLPARSLISSHRLDRGQIDL